MPSNTYQANLSFLLGSKLSSDFGQMMWDVELGWLFAQMYNIDDNPIVVELGSYQGTSSVILASGLKAFKGGLGKLYCIDPWEDVGNIKCSYYNEWLANITKFDLMEIVIAYKEKGADASRRFADKSIDFLFIDSNKIYQDKLDELNAYLPKMKNNGIMCGHDWDGYEPVQAAISKFVFDNKFNIVFPVGNIWWILHRNHKMPELPEDEKYEVYMCPDRLTAKVRKTGTEEYIHTVDLR